MGGDRKLVAGYRCLGYDVSNSNGIDYECEYEPDFPCDECVFVVGYETGDYRKGKRPWSKSASKSG
jgi:hypothetical protein